MSAEPDLGTAQEDSDRQICCTLTNVVLKLIRKAGGEPAVAELLEQAASTRQASYLEGIDNWISLDEACALLEAGVRQTNDPKFARAVGQETLRQHAGTQVATVLRSLGSVEAFLAVIAQTAAKLSTVTEMQAVDVAPGRAVLTAVAREGFTRRVLMCDWTTGLLEGNPILFGLPLAHIEETECQARGGERCSYTITWDAELAAMAADPQQRVTALEAQMVAMSGRLQSAYATASDLVSTEDLDQVLHRIVERAADAVRAPSHILAVRTGPGAELQVYSQGIDSRRAAALAHATLEHGAPERDDQVSSLLTLSHALAQAGTSEEIAKRLAVAVPEVVDCDRMAVWLWDEADERLKSLSVWGGEPAQAESLLGLTISLPDTPYLSRMASEPQPVFFDEKTVDPFLRRLMTGLDAIVLAVIPIVAQDVFLGVLSVSVTDRPERLRPDLELLDRLTGVASLAAPAIQNGRLVDQLRHKATHDGLTGLLNRVGFRQHIDRVLDGVIPTNEQVGLLFIDLNDFKGVNDAHGHEAGDELIRQAATRLNAICRDDDEVARLGGDEFALILSGVNRDDQVRAAEQRVRDAFLTPFQLGKLPISISTSVGGGVWPDDGRTVKELVRHADAAMYRDKAELRSTAKISPESRVTATLRSA